MMKRFLALLLACFLLTGACAQATGVGAPQVNAAIELLKDTWKGVYADLEGKTTATLDIKNVRVVRLTGDYGDDEAAAEVFGDIACVLEFLLYADMYGCGYTMYPGSMYTSVAIHQDGSMEVLSASLFEHYRGLTYSNDFSGIVERVLDFGSQYNKTYTLK